MSNSQPFIAATYKESSKPNDAAIIQLDVDSILERLGNDRGLLNDLIDIYAADIGPLLAELSGAIGGQAVERSVRAAHSIKGLASNFGVTSVSQGALRIERLAHAQDWSDIPKQLHELTRDADTLKQTLELLKLGKGQ